MPNPANPGLVGTKHLCRIAITTILLVLILLPLLGAGNGSSSGSVLVLAQESPEVSLLDFRKGKTPMTDGVDSRGEWDDASTANIFVRTGWQVTVRYKHDGENIFFAFRDVADPEKILLRVPEVVFDLKNDKTPTWNSDDWWFHVSARDCQSQGRFNDYKTCLLEAAGWEANNQRGMATPEIFELRIPYAYIGLTRGRGTRIGIAINVTDTKTTWNFWPPKAVLENPSTWGEAISSDGW